MKIAKIAEGVHEMNRLYCLFLGEKIQPRWKKAPKWQRDATISGVKAIIDELRTRCRRNTPEDIRVATVYYKPEKNKTDRTPDFYIYETEKWLVFPHELDGLTAEEILANKPFPRKDVAIDMGGKKRA